MTKPISCLKDRLVILKNPKSTWVIDQFNRVGALHRAIENKNKDGLIDLDLIKQIPGIGNCFLMHL